MAWTEEKKAEAVQMYKDANPTSETSMQVVKEIAESLEESPNGVRLILTKAEVYIKKEATTASKSKSTTPAKPGETKVARVSKADSQAALEAAIKAAGFDVDSDITSKITGKAATYFAEIISKIGN